MTYEENLKSSCESGVGDCETPLAKLQYLLLARGYTGILQFGRIFRISDDDASHTLNQEEMTEAVNNLGLEFSEEEIQELFSSMDEDGTGTINYEEFLDKLRVS
ncbi:hypothetical protein Pmani_022613 [Petrolisthes manimaculis]|uniref:EF-hand domain-containing protein n=1 Tax=Petrolisthes manimaculis TaxID=1843537 RepID=A0AAE1PCE2_9EUCA|nr:hypothetical protein Pmani_022613 [Petrolisthes manimaculis]